MSSGLGFLCRLQQALEIDHLLTNSTDFADIRQQRYSPSMLEQVLTVDNYAQVLSFPREIVPYKKLENMLKYKNGDGDDCENNDCDKDGNKGISDSNNTIIRCVHDAKCPS